jgi:Tfp pilus assembly PilM family ATPase
MMNIGHPRCGLKLGPTHAAWVDVSRHWWGRCRRRAQQIDLPPGLLRPSPGEPNITDEAALLERLRPLVASRARPWSLRPIVLILPDLCVRSRLLDVERIPARKAERDALIHWRLDKEAFFPMAGARVVSQMVGPKRVLAIVIREAVLEQYETVCRAAGLLAVDIDITGFRLCNLSMPLVPPQQTVAWLSLLDGAFSLVIFRDQSPVFIRTKIHVRSTPDAVLQDLQHSLAYFSERLGSSEVHRLILVAERADSDLQQLLRDELGLEVIQPDWNQLPPKKRLPSNDPSHAGMLAAAAGIFGS